MRTLVFVVMAVAGTAFGSGTNEWDSTVAPGGNTPATAYSWSDPNNWKDKTYAPTSFGDGARLGDASAAPLFIRLPPLGSFGLTYASWATNIHLLGDFVYGDDPTGKFGARQAVTTGSIIYGDFYPDSYKQVAYVGDFAIAGYFKSSTSDPMGRKTAHGSVNGQWGRTGNLTIRMDLFAESSNPVRAAPYYAGTTSLENSGFCFVGPRGAPEQSGTWSQTAGSTYLNMVSMDGTVVPGSVVTGNGIPSGAFVKYVFSTTGWIEISEAATLTIAENSLTFGAITPSVVQTINREKGTFTTAKHFRALKYREEDGCRLVFTNVEGELDNKNFKRYWGLTDADVDAGYIPGDIVISNNTSNASNILHNVVRLELPNVLSTHWYVDQDCNARLTVPDGRTGGIAYFHGGDGLVEKRGAGTLSLGFAESAMAGTIKVAEGTLMVTNTAAVAAGSVVIERLELAAGATFVVPEGGLTVVSLDAARGSTISGGNLTVVNRPVNGLPTLAEGAELTFRFGYSAAEVFPASSLRLHFDASVLSSITTNATGGITRWDDLSGSGDYLANNGRTGGVSEYATNRFNAANGLPMVDLGPFCWTNVGPDKATEKDRSFYLKKSDGTMYTKDDADAGALSFPNCRSVLCVIDSRYGGGPLIGQPGTGIALYYSYSPFPCGIRNMEDWEDQQDARYYAHSDVQNSAGDWVGGVYSDTSLDVGSLIFRVNGESKNPSKSKFTGGLEIVSYAYMWGSKYGCFGLGTWAYGRTANGLMYGEVVVFSNELSLAEIELAERYLNCKWANAEDSEFYNCVSVDAISLGAGSTLSGINGHAFATAALSGTGTVDGDLALDENAVFNVAIDGASVPMLTVTGKATLPANATVMVSGSLSGVAIGNYPILSAGSIVGSAQGWEAECEDDRRYCRVLVDGNRIVLSVRPSGMAIFVR